MRKETKKKGKIIKRAHPLLLIVLCIAIYAVIFFITDSIFLSIFLSLLFVMTWKLVVDTSLLLANKIDEINDKIIKELRRRK